MKAKNTFFLLFLFLIPLCTYSQESETKVLFGGNSFTYFWNVPQLVQSMAESQNVTIRTSQSTTGGATWEDH